MKRFSKTLISIVISIIAISVFKSLIPVNSPEFIFNIVKILYMLISIGCVYFILVAFAKDLFHLAKSKF